MLVAQSLAAAHSADATFLARLGDRVRAWRERHGVTRRSLAEASAMSERYLAQMESGQGNMSILLLRQLAQAMEVSLDALVADSPHDSAERVTVQQLLAGLSPPQLARAQRVLLEYFGERRARVALVGLRGAGKSTLGAKLAGDFGVPLVELDREVEREAGASLSELFGMYGQEGFRRFGHRALERVLAENERAVIATGGGLVTAPETYQRLLAACFTVWLKAAPEEHMARVIAQGDMRPIHGHAEAMDNLRQLLLERTHLYAQADVAVDTAGRTIKQSLQALRQAVQANHSRDHA